VKQLIAQTMNWLADATKIRVLPDRLPHPKDSNVETLKLPGYVQSQSYTCGFVAGLMILHYFRPDFPAEKFYERIRPHERKGVSRRRLMDCLRWHELRVIWRTDLDFSGIVDAIDEGRPIAVVVRARDRDADHWVVIYGYGRKPNRAFVAANGIPLLSRKQYPWGFFKQHYWEMPGFGLVCAGAGKTHKQRARRRDTVPLVPESPSPISIGRDSRLRASGWMGIGGGVTAAVSAPAH
jgi:hypothetical protein